MLTNGLINNRMKFKTDIDFAQLLDQEDTLQKFRSSFHIPKQKNGKDFLYFCGNSLGLQPVSVEQIMMEELEDWKNLGVEGHFHARRPWMPYHELFNEKLSKQSDHNDIPRVSAAGNG